MARCRFCSSSFDDSRVTCPVCGNPVSGSAGGTTAAQPAASPSPTPRDRASTSASAGRDPSSSASQGRFLPGTILAGRYRVVAPLGRGGMGEVYRADDLKLGQSVALKLLPEGFGDDGGRLTRFLNEVRIARRVSHPNVCRVYDIGDVDGQHFISMEYVDGEDLASLLRRIGRLPEDKAVQIARELCAGIAAAHDKGVLHRDLKPANVMIDGNGRVSITDFGLAAISGELDENDVLSGTPAYMAPEQLTGSEASVGSDIYALGLILYEMLTGKRAFDGNGIAEMSRLHRDSTPATPSSLKAGLDPVLERVVMRCLEKDPANRPASALAVAAALPGGDPLAAALAAGETPSPRMVAAAGADGGMSPRSAWLCLAVSLTGMILLLFLAGRSNLVMTTPLGKSPAVMTERAREVVERLGHDVPARDQMTGMNLDLEAALWARKNSADPAGGASGIYRFWYRSSPRPLVPVDVASGSPSFNDPPATTSGMVSLMLDAAGSLIYFVAVPAQKDTTLAATPAADWAPLFAAAGLDPEAFTPATPEWNIPVATDSRAAWTGPHPRWTGLPIRVEAAAWKGKPVSFEIIWPWSRPARMQDRPLTGSEKIARLLNVLVFLVVLVLSTLAAIRNTRRGLSDVRGAVRLGTFLAALQFLGWLIESHHVADEAELTLFTTSLAFTTFTFALAALLYIAIEPYVRRLYPNRLITWVRVLEGRFRDPLVGRDLLIGAAGGITMATLLCLRHWAAGWLGLELPVPDSSPILMSPTRTAAIVLNLVQSAVFNGLIIMSFFLLFRVLLRKESIALAVVAFILTMIVGPASLGPTLTDRVTGGLFSAVFLFLLVRFGMLAAIAGFLTQFLTQEFPVTFGANPWFAGYAVTVQILAAALVIYAFVTALGGTPMFRDSVLDER